MSTIIYPSPIFGPVHSRRLGVSLGINLLPEDGKFCTFDCIYCECGFNEDHRPKKKLPTREQVREALEARLIDMQQNGPKPDVLTFAGNGEPTAHPHFAGIIEDGYGTVVTSMNLASAQQQLGEYDEAEAELLGALEDYPYDYRVDMRLAFLYADWQSVRDIEDRDYSEVEYYYDQATAKYQQAQANGTQDADMQILGNLISQLRSSGWL